MQGLGRPPGVRVEAHSQTQPRSATYRRILVAVDSSDQGDRAADLGIGIAECLGAVVTGVHAFAGELHGLRFRQMEGSLPERYRRQQILEKQREAHAKLITRGLASIADSYLDCTERLCATRNVPFFRRAVEGKNYRAILQEAESGRHDLVVLGSSGLGSAGRRDVGTVCERVARRAPMDVLVVKSDDPPFTEAPLLVAVDGSRRSFGGLVTALELARAFGTPLHVVAAYDPFFHAVAFTRIREVLSAEAERIFHFEEQEKLHDEVIDAGLAKVYRAHLAVAASIAKQYGIPARTTLLRGKPAHAILDHLEKTKPALLVVGKTGLHADDGLDIGGVTEQLLRRAEVNLLISSREHATDPFMIAGETISWTIEAEARLKRAPDLVRGMAEAAIVHHAVEKGHTVITDSVVDDALASFSSKVTAPTTSGNG